MLKEEFDYLRDMSIEWFKEKDKLKDEILLLKNKILEIKEEKR